MLNNPDRRSELTRLTGSRILFSEEILEFSSCLRTDQLKPEVIVGRLPSHGGCEQQRRLAG